jgi:hypothetical protein
LDSNSGISAFLGIDIGPVSGLARSAPRRHRFDTGRCGNRRLPPVQQIRRDVVAPELRRAQITPRRGDGPVVGLPHAVPSVLIGPQRLRIRWGSLEKIPPWDWPVSVEYRPKHRGIPEYAYSDDHAGYLWNVASSRRMTLERQQTSALTGFVLGVGIGPRGLAKAQGEGHSGPGCAREATARSRDTLKPRQAPNFGKNAPKMNFFEFF